MTDAEILAAARLLQPLHPDARRRLASTRPRARNVAAGETIFEAGDPADSVFLVAEAGSAWQGEPLVQLRLHRNGADAALRFARVVKGDILGETEFLAAGLDPRGAKRTTSARALTPARLIVLSWSDLSALFDIDPAIRMRLVRLATRRLNEALWAQHSQGNENPDILLADWLVEYAADLGVAAVNRVSFAQRFSQSDIADEIGVTRETVSRRLKEWERSGLVVSSAGGLEVVDYSRLVRIAGLAAGCDRAALAAAVSDLAAEIDRGDLLAARNIGADMLRFFPASPELLHLTALAAARSGDGEEAAAVLRSALLAGDGDFESLRDRIRRGLANPFAASERPRADDWLDEAFDDADEEIDLAGRARLVERLASDIAALEARLLKDRAFADGDRAEASAAAASFRAYESIHRATGGWYAGVNAAAMALASGRPEARSLAEATLTRVPKDAGDYWALATIAEASIIAGDNDAGLVALKRASVAADATDSSRASTALQLRRLAPHLGLDAGVLLAALGVRRVAVVTGHMFRGAEMDVGVQAAACALVREKAEAILSEQNVGQVFGALACGADIVVAEAAIGLGVPFHAVAPFPLPRYVALSVDIGDPAGAAGSWRARFEAVLARAASLTLVDDEMPLDRDLDGHFFHGFRFTAGLALIRAEQLQAECRLLAVTDDGAVANIAGSNRAVADWQASGRAVDRIGLPLPRRHPGPRSRGASSFRACVFLWDTAGARSDRSAVAEAAVAGTGYAVVERALRSGREGSCVIAPDLEAALRLAEAVAARHDSLRAVCDFGPVVGADGEPDPKMVARLKAASDMPGFPPGRPLATLAFATQAKTELGERLRVAAVGRSEESRLAEPESGEAARRRPGLPVFRLSLSA